MRLVEVIKSVKDEDYLCRVVDATEVERLYSRGLIDAAQRDAAERFHASWYDAGLGGRGRTSWERSGSTGFGGSSYERMGTKQEHAYRSYTDARESINSRYVHEVSNVCLYDLACGSIVALQRGLEQLVKHYKLQ